MNAAQVVDPTSTTLAQIGNPYTFVASTNKPIMLFPAGMQSVRMRLSTVVTGTGSITPFVTIIDAQAVQSIFLAAQYAAFTSSVPPGSAIVGKFGIDQSTPGTTNNVTLSPLPAASRHFPGCTVTTSSSSCLAASTAATFVQIQNTSASASMACAWGAAAVLNSSGSFQLAAGQAASWGPMTGGIPSGALNCIASAGSTPAYLEYN